MVQIIHASFIMSLKEKLDSNLTPNITSLCCADKWLAPSSTSPIFPLSSFTNNTVDEAIIHPSFLSLDFYHSLENLNFIRHSLSSE